MKRVLIAAALALASCGEATRAYVSYPNDTPALVPRSLPAFFDCLRERDQTVVSAHRGGSRGSLPENGLRTFGFTLAHVPVFLEVDVRAARDGLIVMHDETVDRTTNGEGAVAGMTVDQIRALTLDGMPPGEHPPSLREALDWASGRTVLELDIKQDVRFEDVVGDLRRADAMNRVVLITYSVGAAARLAGLAPDAMLYVTIDTESDLDELERRGVDLSHVVAWTRDEEPNSALNIALAQRGVEARFGMFGSGALASQASAFAETGLQIISTDAAEEVVESLDANDGEEGYAALQCAAAQ